MNTSEHTVTIPIVDYQELIENKSLSEDKRALFKFIQSHFDFLASKGIVFSPSTRFDKMPSDCGVEKTYGAAGEKLTIHFRY